MSACATTTRHPCGCRVRSVGGMLSWRCDCDCTPLTWSRSGEVQNA